EVFCQVTLLVHSKELIIKFENAINKIDEVIECFHVAGNYDYLLKIIVKDMKSYQLFLKNKLSVLDSVGNVQSTFVMSSTKDTSILKVT
ncbi:MAG: AsnC family transcriptional regulator, partial [Lutibacter sp.]|uniref:Lrp/AsnC family transcriptional regulator n=1 Tax=Lutibacter sp. TaxID=1925666 RepID=UPI0019DAD92D